MNFVIISVVLPSIERLFIFFFHFFLVDGGHRAVIFDRFQGIKQGVVGEGTHFFIPWVQRPIIFDIRSQPRNVPVITGSKDLQNVNITLRILFRPIPDQLPRIYTILGQDYEERVLPSITTEVLKAVVAQFDAGELITQREVRFEYELVILGAEPFQSALCILAETNRFFQSFAIVKSTLRHVSFKYVVPQWPKNSQVANVEPNPSPP